MDKIHVEFVSELSPLNDSESKMLLCQLMIQVASIGFRTAKNDATIKKET